jgi:hypothetical protein
MFVIINGDDGSAHADKTKRAAMMRKTGKQESKQEIQGGIIQIHNQALSCPWINTAQASYNITQHNTQTPFVILASIVAVSIPSWGGKYEIHDHRNGCCMEFSRVFDGMYVVVFLSIFFLLWIVFVSLYYNSTWNHFYNSFIWYD